MLVIKKNHEQKDFFAEIWYKSKFTAWALLTMALNEQLKHLKSRLTDRSSDGKIKEWMRNWICPLFAKLTEP